MTAEMSYRCRCLSNRFSSAALLSSPRLAERGDLPAGHFRRPFMLACREADACRCSMLPEIAVPDFHFVAEVYFCRCLPPRILSSPPEMPLRLS